MGRCGCGQGRVNFCNWNPKNAMQKNEKMLDQIFGLAKCAKKMRLHFFSPVVGVGGDSGRGLGANRTQKQLRCQARDLQETLPTSALSPSQRVAVTPAKERETKEKRREACRRLKKA